MIYIPFFIVILIDMRGVREAERERGDTRYDVHTIQRTIHITKRGKRALHQRKEV